MQERLDADVAVNARPWFGPAFPQHARAARTTTDRLLATSMCQVAAIERWRRPKHT